ncbi:hypothetical protein B566_EDAN004485 [Ephemera danica]|nr:hypothetical protein B566_EDAN004485 [Ephemera danica]
MQGESSTVAKTEGRRSWCKWSSKTTSRNSRGNAASAAPPFSHREPSRRTARGEQRPRYQCRHCGKSHDESTCPAGTWNCFYCGGLGHTISVCKKKKSSFNSDQESESDQESVSDQESEYVSEDIESYDQDLNDHYDQTDKPLLLNVKVNDKFKSMEIYSGAGCNIISKELYDIEYIGHILDSKGIHPSQKHTDTLVHNLWFTISEPKPCDASQLESWIG